MTRVILMGGDIYITCMHIHIVYQGSSWYHSPSRSSRGRRSLTRVDPTYRRVSRRSEEEVKRKLARIDRERARARGNGFTASSCPICLEVGTMTF
jgi:hypothetical protein